MTRITVCTPTVNVPAKLPYLKDALQCLEAQTMPDWEWLLLTDQESDYEALCGLDWMPWGKVTASYATPPADAHPMPWLLNTAFIIADGEFLFSYSDDDLLHPECFETFVRFFEDNPFQNACYVSLQHQNVNSAGVKEADGHWIKAEGIRASGQCDCQIDGGQVCIRKSLLHEMPQPWWPEDRNRGLLRHVDGRYLENVAAVAYILPAGDRDTAYVVHRFTPVSTFTSNTGIIP